MATPAVEHLADRVVAVMIANLLRIAPANGAFWNTIGEGQVYRWDQPPQGADRYPYYIVHDVQELVAEGASSSSANDLYTRQLSVLVEGVAKADRADLVHPATVGWRLLGDLEVACGANLKMEETFGDPSTRLAVDTAQGQGSVLVGVPTEPLVTVTRQVLVRYRSVRDDPYTPR